DRRSAFRRCGDIRADERKCLVIFVFHHLCEAHSHSHCGPYVISPEKFAAFLDFLHSEARPTVFATSSKEKPNTSWRTNVARSAGVRRSSTTSIAIRTLSSSVTRWAGSSGS